MAEGVGNETGRGAFRALQRGFTHWSSGRLDNMEMNCKHPEYCHVRCKMIPSIKSGIYNVYVLLQQERDVASIKNAQCECATG